MRIFEGLEGFYRLTIVRAPPQAAHTAPAAAPEVPSLIGASVTGLTGFGGEQRAEAASTSPMRYFDHSWRPLRLWKS